MGSYNRNLRIFFDANSRIPLRILIPDVTWHKFTDTDLKYVVRNYNNTNVYVTSIPDYEMNDVVTYVWGGTEDEVFKLLLDFFAYIQSLGEILRNNLNEKAFAILIPSNLLPIVKALRIPECTIRHHHAPERLQSADGIYEDVVVSIHALNTETIVRGIMRINKVMEAQGIQGNVYDEAFVACLGTQGPKMCPNSNRLLKVFDVKRFDSVTKTFTKNPMEVAHTLIWSFMDSVKGLNIKAIVDSTKQPMQIVLPADCIGESQIIACIDQVTAYIENTIDCKVDGYYQKETKFLVFMINDTPFKNALAALLIQSIPLLSEERKKNAEKENDIS